MSSVGYASAGARTLPQTSGVPITATSRPRRTQWAAWSATTGSLYPAIKRTSPMRSGLQQSCTRLTTSALKPKQRLTVLHLLVALDPCGDPLSRLGDQDGGRAQLEGGDPVAPVDQHRRI